jgi:hypothetical protein
MATFIHRTIMIGREYKLTTEEMFMQALEAASAADLKLEDDA